MKQETKGDSPDYETERDTPTQFFLWQLILVAWIILLTVVAWPHMFNQG